jgi:hypothetical protein
VQWSRLSRRLPRDGRSAEAAIAVTTVATVVIVVALVLRLWDAYPHIPLDYGGDTTFYASVIKDVLDHGWYNQNPDLGAPLGQELYDFPQGGDNLNFLLIKGLGLLSSNPALVMNLFFLLMFPLSALTALFVMRTLGISRGPAFLASVLFAVLPYHFGHGEAHLFISAYYMVPLSAYLILAILGGRPLFGRREGNGLLVTRFATRRSLLTVSICVVVASANVYYAIFSVLLLAIATLLASTVRRSKPTFAAGAVVLVVIAATMFANFAPSLAYFAAHGRDALVAQRAPWETEEFGLKLTNLVLPVDGHRFGPFARLKDRYDTTTLLPENSQEGAQTLGLLGTIGFVWLVIVALMSIVGRRKPAPSLDRDLATANIAAFLIGTTAGVSSLIAYLVSAQLRSWGRISIFIGFFALLALALLLDSARQRFARTALRQWAFRVALVALVVFGVADQTTRRMVPSYAATAAAWRSDDAFVKSIQRRLPRGAEIYQLPYVSFPEAGGPGGTGPYDSLRPYLHSSGLRWSTAAMRGRPADEWQARLSAAGVADQVRAAAAIGFSGIVVDRRGYDDSGGSLEQQLGQILGTKQLVSFDRRLTFFDLRPYARRLRNELTPRQLELLKQASLYPAG